MASTCIFFTSFSQATQTLYNIPDCASPFMSHCIRLRWVGLIAPNFFFRWISSIFHGGSSVWPTATVDVDVVVVAITSFICRLTQFHGTNQNTIKIALNFIATMFMTRTLTYTINFITENCAEFFIFFFFAFFRFVKNVDWRCDRFKHKIYTAMQSINRVLVNSLNRYIENLVPFAQALIMICTSNYGLLRACGKCTVSHWFCAQKEKKKKLATAKAAAATNRESISWKWNQEAVSTSSFNLFILFL